MKDQIINTVCSYYKINNNEIVDSRSRKEDVALARHVAQYLIYQNAGMTLKQIGDFFGRRHSTVIYAVNRIHGQLTNKFDQTIKNDIKNINELLPNE